MTTGLGARHLAAPLGLPPPGTPEDELILDSLSQDIDALEIVQSLRAQSYNLHNDTALRSGPGLREGGGGGRKISAYKGWLELDLDLGRREGEEGKSGILGVMSGTRGLGVQRAFWSAETREMVAVVWIGGGLAGWPGVAHGGAIATVFEEVMARMVRGPEGGIGMYKLQSDPNTTLQLSSHGHGRYGYAEANVTSRASPPPRLPINNLRETNIQPRLLHPARFLLETRFTAIRTSFRTRI
jgi:hypothetical protein